MLPDADSAWCPTGFRRAGSTPVPRRAPVCARRVAGGRGAGLGGDAHDGLPVVSRLEGRGAEGAQGGGTRRPQAAARRGAHGRGRRGAAAGGSRPRIQHRPVDPGPYRGRDRTGHRGSLPPGACVVSLAAPELVAATPRPPRPRTRRAGNSAVGAATLARGKKNARRQRAWIIFEDESGLSTQPVVRRTWARYAGGRPLAIEPAEVTATARRA